MSMYACCPPLPSPERGFPMNISVDPTDLNRIAYPSGNNVILRNFHDSADVFMYTAHAGKRVQAVAISPNGHWVASGDNSGILRVWGSRGDHADKGEFRMWNGDIRGICWSPDNQRIAVCGSGREVSAACIMWDTGNKLGDMSGHQKAVNAIAFRPSRPFRIATGSEDSCVNFYEGPPFKFKISNTGRHTNFVQGATFTPSGDLLLTCGSDGLVNVYEGLTGEFLYAFPKLPSTAFSLACPDDNTVVVAYADKHVRCYCLKPDTAALVWEVEVGEDLGDQQIGMAVAGKDAVITTCLDGRLLKWSVPDGKLIETLTGSSGRVCSVVHNHSSNSILWTSTDTTLHEWQPESNQVACLARGIRPSAGVVVDASGPVMVDKDGNVLHTTAKGGVVSDVTLLLDATWTGGSPVLYSAKRCRVETIDGQWSAQLPREPLAVILRVLHITG